MPNQTLNLIVTKVVTKTFVTRQRVVKGKVVRGRMARGKLSPNSTLNEAYPAQETIQIVRASLKTIGDEPPLHLRLTIEGELPPDRRGDHRAARHRVLQNKGRKYHEQRERNADQIGQMGQARQPFHRVVFRLCRGLQSGRLFGLSVGQPMLEYFERVWAGNDGSARDDLYPLLSGHRVYAPALESTAQPRCSVGLRFPSRLWFTDRKTNCLLGR
jgi:hypothetical protein